jgi:hypothetical protein
LILAERGIEKRVFDGWIDGSKVAQVDMTTMEGLERRKGCRAVEKRILTKSDQAGLLLFYRALAGTREDEKRGL